MNKLKLDLDQLTVESFDTDASGIARRGTVRAHSHLCGPSDVCTPTWGELTCGDTCDNTCNTCGASCGCGGGSGYNSCYGSCGETCNTCITNCEQESCGVIYCP
ncbi:hypothetical protein [Longimicrobium sp.]|uniref:hypothetical protein n=1 Tax=Longimicrobium sp. TaxID=2029185 RepID=UPI002E2EB410|nr:hypothetical protein [Longimicrobium sp.]HEX6037679.1 hypothetical protein [Longimicrobium sp.]